MAYVKTNWKDRVVERPNTYNMTDNGNGTVTLTPVPGQIIERGTPLNAENLNKIEDAIVETNAQLSANKQELGNRIDNIVANNNSTDGNSELIDVRIGYDGFNYGSAGSAVRAQINSVDYDINDLKNSLSLKRINLFDNKNLLVNKFAKNESHSTINDFGDRENTVTSGQFFKVKKGDKINTNLDLILYYLYDANGIFIERLTDGAREHTIQNENAFYMRLVYNNYGDGKIERLVMTINEDEFPQEFVPYTEVSITTKEMANFEKRITDLEKATEEHKTYILINFDDMSDMYHSRLEIMKEYGFKFSCCLTSGIQVYENGFYNEASKERFYDLLDYGCDITLYGIDRFTSIETDFYSRTVEEWIKLYKPVLDKANSMGVFPVTYFAPTNTLTENAITALKKLGFVVSRSGKGNPENKYSWIEEFNDKRFNTPTVQIHNDNLSTIKGYIDTCIDNGYALSIFTHQVLDNNTEDLHCDTVVFRELLDYIKLKVDAGLCEVVTYQEFLNIKHGYRTQHLRDVKRMNFIERKLTAKSN